ncbi:MAG TPA: AAA family ATPase [Dehalococcoidia bacterium]|nr:AAA family ATPase [Dehalococcoidia bacterium]
MSAPIHLHRAVIICGGIASGKSSLARSIAVRLAYVTVSFGGLVSDSAVERGVPVSRGALQELGAQMISSMGVHSLVQAALHRAKAADGGDVVIEGVRHPSVLLELRTIADLSVSVFLKLDQRRRYERFALKDTDDPSISREEFTTFDNHPVEAETPELEPLADIVIDAAMAAGSVRDQVLEALASRGFFHN